MSRRAAMAAAAVLGFSGVASAAVSPSLRKAHLQGTFALRGRVTVAVHVNGEHAGQRVSRTWTFAPLCASGQCARVRLTRTRPGGTDTLTLHLTAPAHYVGSGRFYAPLRCAGRVAGHGESVPFTIKVRITAASHSSGGMVATRIAATYTNRWRVNRTRCVAPPSHDAAVYTGRLESTGRLRSPTPASPPARAASRLRGSSAGS